MTKRKLTVGYRAQKHFNQAVPFIRIGNRFLKNSGFNIGDKVEILYCDKQIIIKHLN